MKILSIALSLLSLNAFANITEISKNLEPFVGTIAKENIVKTKIDGIYEVITTNPIDSIFTSNDGKFIIRGDIIDLESRGLMAKSHKIKGLIKTELDKITDKDKIIFQAKNEKYFINVFTDVDCPFCAKLHAEMPKLNELGITVKYLAAPLAQLHPAAQGKMEKIWCAEDRVQAMDEYKKNRIVPDSKACTNPVAEQLQISEKVGVNGTPSIFLPDGTNIAGYMPATSLLKRIEQNK
jgi:thiol:disulfide interchange protein DsbC